MFPLFLLLAPALAAPTATPTMTSTSSTTANSAAITTTSLQTVKAFGLHCEPSEYRLHTKTEMTYEDELCIVNEYVFTTCRNRPPSTCPPEEQVLVTKTWETDSGFDIWTTTGVVTECVKQTTTKTSTTVLPTKTFTPTPSSTESKPTSTPSTSSRTSSKTSTLPETTPEAQVSTIPPTSTLYSTTIVTTISSKIVTVTVPCDSADVLETKTESDTEPPKSTTEPPKSVGSSKSLSPPQSLSSRPPKFTLKIILPFLSQNRSPLRNPLPSQPPRPLNPPPRFLNPRFNPSLIPPLSPNLSR